MIVLDTHTWIWWVSNPELLSDSAQKTIDAAISDRSIYISCISTWEIAMLVAKDRLRFTTDITDWIVKSEALPFVSFIPLNNTIALKSIHLPGSFHNDPVDRIIVATTLSLGATLVTKDDKIRDYPYVKTIW
ncbi:MAG: type II toxin-antitoxin system VapC family toxin [Pseudomonadota bacterium]